MPSKHRRHWYRLHLGECPLCGRDQSWRERVYGPKPKRWKNRVVLEPLYACSEHFV